jgi:hypothetical protein
MLRVCSVSAAHAVFPWSSLAGLRGSAERCTCSDDQLNLVGCDCDAGQNLPVRCAGNSAYSCEAFLRTNDEIEAGQCRDCQTMSNPNYVGHPMHY